MKRNRFCLKLDNNQSEKIRTRASRKPAPSKSLCGQRKFKKKEHVIKIGDREKKYIIDKIKLYILKSNLEKACDLFLTVCHSPQSHQETLYKLGIEILSRMSCSNTLILRFHNMFLEILKHKKMELDIFMNEILLNIPQEDPTQINTLYLKVCSKLVQMSGHANPIYKVIRGVLEYSLWKNTLDVSYMKKCADHLSAVTQLQYPFLPYFDFYFSFLVEIGLFEVLRERLLESLEKFPTTTYFYQKFFLYSSSLWECPINEQYPLLMRLIEFDPLNPLANSHLIKILEKDKKLEMVNLLFRRLEISENWKNKSDLEKLLHALYDIDEDDKKELNKIFLDFQGLWSIINQEIVRNVRHELPEDKTVINIREEISSVIKMSLTQCCY